MGSVGSPEKEQGFLKILSHHSCPGKYNSKEQTNSGCLNGSNVKWHKMSHLSFKNYIKVKYHEFKSLSPT